MKIEAFAGSHPGRIRSNNEDSFLVDQETGIFAVADGMGGHASGEVASRMVVLEVSRQAASLARGLRGRHSRDDRRRTVIHLLPRILEKANEEIFNRASREPSMWGMGTTALLFCPLERDGFICHVGDSRLYLHRQGEIFQVTEDHSLVMRLYKEGRISQEELRTHPQRNIIVRCIGLQPTVEVETLYLDVMPGDTFVLCSDGLSDMLTPKELAFLIQEYHGQELVDSAIELANYKGGHDNITLVVVHVLEDDHPAPEAPGVMDNVLQKVEFLQDIFLFKDLSDQECLKINRVLYEHFWPVDQAIYTAGSQGDKLFIIAEGQVGLWQGEALLTTLGPGAHFGEFGFIDDEPRSCDVITLTPCTLFSIARDDLLELFRTDPILGNKVYHAFLRHLANRVRDLSKRVAGGDDGAPSPP